MKTTEWGNARYIVQVYYTDEQGRFREHLETWCGKKNAKEMSDHYKGYMGQFYDTIDWKGTISSVWTYKAKLCDFID